MNRTKAATPEAPREIVTPEGRYWPGRGPNGEDVTLFTGKRYPAEILEASFLARCLEDGIVTLAEPTDSPVVEAPTTTPTTGEEK